MQSKALKSEYLLIVGTIVFFLICYKLAFSHTIAAWNQHRNLKALLENSASMSNEPGYVSRKAANINKVIDKYTTDTLSFRNTMVNTLSLLAAKQNVKLTGVPADQGQFHTDQFIVEKAVLKGDYFSLLKFMSDVEKEQGIGRLQGFRMSIRSDEAETTSNTPSLELYLIASKK